MSGNRLGTYAVRSARISKWALCIALMSTALSLNACTNASIAVAPTTAKKEGPGIYTIPPKVDLLMVVDDTGSAFQFYDDIDKQGRAFLSKLGDQAWDFHFATIPLTTFRSVQQVVGSKFDANSGASWVPPFPGAVKQDISSLPSAVFRFISDAPQYTDFLTKNDLSSSRGGDEPGFENLLKVMKTGIGSSGFLRSDALLVILLIGNGDDTSGVNYCKRQADGLLVRCEDDGHSACVPTDQDPIRGGSKDCGSSKTSFDYYRSQLQGIAGSMKFFAAVSAKDTSQCFKGSASAGIRYQQMATALGGKSYDICRQSIQSILSDLNTQLQGQRVAYKTRYLLMDREPDVSTIKVTRFAGGGTDGVELVEAKDFRPGDPVPPSGWAYVGFQKDMGLIYTTSAAGREIQMNLASGYAVQLLGSSELEGSDSASLQFLPKGLQNSK